MRPCFRFNILEPIQSLVIGCIKSRRENPVFSVTPDTKEACKNVELKCFLISFGACRFLVFGFWGFFVFLFLLQNILDLSKVMAFFK